jgi:hypothetical protein
LALATAWRRTQAAPHNPTGLAWYRRLILQRAAAEGVLLQFQQHPDAWTRVDTILSESKMQQTRYIALKVRERQGLGIWLQYTTSEGVGCWRLSLQSQEPPQQRQDEVAAPKTPKFASRAVRARSRCLALADYMPLPASRAALLARPVKWPNAAQQPASRHVTLRLAHP